MLPPPLEPSAGDSRPPEPPSVVLLEEWSEQDRLRVREIQKLLRHQGQADYGAAQKRAARRLGISVRSVQRMMQRWRQDGVAGVVRSERRDKGQSQLSQAWQRYILETWRAGNREGRRLSPAQVYLRVRARAVEIGDERSPSHMSVYRLLRPEIEKKRQSQFKIQNSECKIEESASGLQLVEMSKPLDITERTFEFAVRIIKLCQVLDETPGAGRTLSKQLIRCGTSIGANVEEAQSGQSKRDFVHKLEIALKEARETKYWLRLLVAAELLSESRLSPLMMESEELIKILASIIIKSKKNL